MRTVRLFKLLSSRHKVVLKFTRTRAVFAALATLLIVLFGVERIALYELSPADPASSPTCILKDDVVPAAWSYFRPAWKETALLSPFTLQSSSTNRFPGSAVGLSNFINDPKERIEKDFRINSSLEHQVLFWMAVYTGYSSHMRIVHDRNDLSIVYGFIDLRSLYRSIPPSEFLEKKIDDIEQGILKELRSRLTEAGGLAKNEILPAQEKAEVQAFLSRIGSLRPKDIRNLISSLRTQSGQNDMFMMALYRSKSLLPFMETVFRKQGLPTGLARIPFVESSFNINALSKAGAAGIWQFTPETAREWLPTAQPAVWTDPVVQTQGAARLLKLYRSILPDWGSAITSYNSGIGRVRRLIQKYQALSVEELVRNSITDPEGLGFAGRNFYAEFLAANLVEAYKEDIFKPWPIPMDLFLVFRGITPFPEAACSIKG
ncbi:MAG: transglycosylase SLT domain-containing protein [Deltaproteobacteria bacterium]|nr:transglycosylase SLT domain-containing protein [Deltaproteobacteria bacterium]